MSKLTEDQIFDLQKLISQKKANVLCPMCKSTTFDVVKREAIIAFPETVNTGIVFSSLDYRKCLVNVCANCGFVLMFDIAALSK